MELEFIFVGGTGRSGTTVLSEILNDHSSCARFDYELRFHIDPKGLFDLYQGLCVNWDVYRGAQAAFDFALFFEKLVSYSFYTYHKKILWKNSKEFYLDKLTQLYKDLGITTEKRLWIGNSNLLAKTLSKISLELSDYLTPTFFCTYPVTKEIFCDSVSKFFKSLFAEDYVNINFVVEHTPYNFIYFEFLSDIFTNSKFIHIKRHPFDIVTSYSAQGWGSRYLSNNCKQIVALYNMWLEKKKFLSNYIEISLEDLQSNTATTFDKLSEYLGLDRDGFSISSFDVGKSNINRWQVLQGSFEGLDCYADLREVATKLGY